MYRVLLVEDEILERENTRESRIWKNGEFELYYDAANGQEAWAKLQNSNIDILITDIKMPFMDGLELSRLVRQNMPHIKIIILSGYSEFAYAQQALSIGVSEYIVKPIKSAELLEAMYRAAEQIKAERSKEKDMEMLREQVSSNKLLQVNKLLDDLTLGIFQEKDLKDRADFLGIDIVAEYYIGVILRYSDQKLLSNKEDHLLALDIQEIAYSATQDYGVLAFHKDLKDIYLLFKGDTEEDLLKKTQQVIHVIKNEINKKIQNCKPIFAAGSIGKDIPSIPESFANANLILNFSFTFANQDIIFMNQNHLEEINKNYGANLSLNTEKNLMENLLKFGTILEIKPIVNKLINKMKALHFNYVLYQYTCAEFINMFKSFLSDLGENDLNKYGLDFNDLFKLENWLKWFNDIESFGSYLINVINKIFNIRDQKKNYKFANVISVAKKYIDENYTNPELNLNSIATIVNISSSYLSTLFNQEMGESIIEYLTRIRVEKAKELLRTTSLRTTDIAFEIGYQDSNYFSKIFKRITNQTPRDYRS